MTEEEFRSGTLANGERLMQHVDHRASIIAWLCVEAAKRQGVERRVLRVAADGVRAELDRQETPSPGGRESNKFPADGAR